MIGIPQRDWSSTDLNTGDAVIARYNGSTWVSEGTVSNALLPGVYSDGALAGAAVSVSEDVVVVGARRERCVGSLDLCGLADVFRYAEGSWEWDQRLRASDEEPDAEFGHSVAVSGGTLLVGARYDDCSGSTSSCGSAYVFHYNGTSWDEIEILRAEPEDSGSTFGYTVAVDGSAALIGAPGYDLGSDIFVFATSGDSDGDGFADVCDQCPHDPANNKDEAGNCIPTVSAWGIAVMLLLVLTGGTLLIRRHRAPDAP